MNIHQFFRFITVDPVNLSIKGKLLSVISSFIAILIVAWVTKKFGVSAAYPIIVASMDASAVILFIMPNSPLAQPWPFVGGHLVSAIIHGETVLNFLTWSSQYNFPRIICHSQVVENPSHITS